MTSKGSTWKNIIKFSSSTPDIRYYAACEEKQTITQGPHIINDINRTFEGRVKSWRTKTVLMYPALDRKHEESLNPLQTVTYKVPNEMERVVVHTGGKDYEIVKERSN